MSGFEFSSFFLGGGLGRGDVGGVVWFGLFFQGVVGI